MPGIGEDALVAAAVDGDRAAFVALAEPRRRELVVHCYRMLGSFSDAVEAADEALSRAWSRRQAYDRRVAFPAWLYRVATHVCFEHLTRSGRRVDARRRARVSLSPAAVPWLQPFPDEMLEDAAFGSRPGRETIELGYIAAIQHLPVKQRAAVILRDVLGWSALESSELLDTGVAALNSALQRARSALHPLTVDQRARSVTRWGGPDEHRLLQRYMDAHERGDIAAAVALVHDGVRCSTPTEATTVEGRDALAAVLHRELGPSAPGIRRMVPTRANRHPAAAHYLRRPGDHVFRPRALEVLRFERHQVVEITTFRAEVFGPFGLPVAI